MVYTGSRTPKGMTWPIPLLNCLLAVILPATARAQDAALGAGVARTHCSVCHQIDQNEPGRNSRAPSFHSIAQDDRMTQSRLIAFLGRPHAGMPDFFLTYEEERDLSAFILSQRGASR
jgi:mono/diheme cytochrome c family protein